MSDAEYKAFLEYLFHTHVQNRLDRADHHMGHPFYSNEWSYVQNRLRRAMAVIQHIQSFCDDTNDIHATFQPQKLRDTISDVRSGVHVSRRLAEDTGFLDAIDSYYDEIIEGLKPEHFPESELAILRSLGSDNPKRDIQAIIYILKLRRLPPGFRADQTSVRNRLKRVEDQLSIADKEFSEAAEQAESLKETTVPKKSRRWFKGLGQIAQGAALSLADIALAVGSLNFPVSPETQTWGSLVSTTTGIGMVLTGVGEFKGE